MKNKGLQTPYPYIFASHAYCPVTVLQRYRDGVCNLLVPLFFIMCHPSIPLYFLVSSTITGGKPLEKNSGRYRFEKRAIVCARNWRRALLLWLCHADERFSLET